MRGPLAFLTGGDIDVETKMSRYLPRFVLKDGPTVLNNNRFAGTSDLNQLAIPRSAGICLANYFRVRTGVPAKK
jgi:hypothetical protein